MSHHAAVHRSSAVAPVFLLIVPGLDGVAPAVLLAGHVQVLPAAAGWSQRERERSFRGVLVPAGDWKPLTKVTADLSGAARAVVHGAGVCPLLSVGCSL